MRLGVDRGDDAVLVEGLLAAVRVPADVAEERVDDGILAEQGTGMGDGELLAQ